MMLWFISAEFWCNHNKEDKIYLFKESHLHQKIYVILLLSSIVVKMMFSSLPCCSYSIDQDSPMYSCLKQQYCYPFQQYLHQTHDSVVFWLMITFTNMIWNYDTNLINPHWGICSSIHCLVEFDQKWEFPCSNHNQQQSIFSGRIWWIVFYNQSWLSIQVLCTAIVGPVCNWHGRGQINLI